jgi:DNA primase
VISMHQSGVENVVASSGTALTEEQIKLMRRFTENVTVLFDGDAAGIKAALRGIDLVLKGGLNVRVVLLPDGEDPDSYSKKMGSTEFQRYLRESSTDFISFKINLLSGDAARDPIKKAEAIRDIVTSISVIPDPIKRSVYIRETSDLLKIQEPVLLTELNKILIQDRRKQQQETVREEPMPPVDSLVEHMGPSRTDTDTMIRMQERETVRLLLNYAESPFESDQKLADFLLQELEDVEFIDPVLKEIYDTFRKGAAAGERVDNFYFLENGTPEVKKLVADLMTSRYETSPHWSERYHIFFPHEKEVIHEVAMSNVLRLKFRLIQKLIEDNLKEMKEVTDEVATDRHLRVHEELKNAQKELAGMLGIVIPR